MLDMGLHVIDQSTLLPKLHLAIGTGIGLIAGVYLLVICQCRQLREGLIASIAFVGLWINVRSLVILQRTQLREALLADTTHIGFDKLLSMRGIIAARVQTFGYGSTVSVCKILTRLWLLTRLLLLLLGGGQL